MTLALILEGTSNLAEETLDTLLIVGSDRDNLGMNQSCILVWIVLIRGGLARGLARELAGLVSGLAN